ncbi:hypothetical protein SS05631_c21310 [Sinorhizobium sp. CCBAU 05631]|nr:hypothetical protein SS05631_c21310 [Sinorhizobium sp. CCBAU 05631]
MVQLAFRASPDFVFKLPLKHPGQVPQERLFSWNASSQ